MRRIATWLLVGAVAALGAAAGVDAFRDGGEPAGTRARGAPTRAEPDDPTAAALREAGVSGTLHYAGEDCVVHAVALPSLRENVVAGEGVCRTWHTPAGELVFPGAAPAETELSWWCRGGTIEFRLPSGNVYGRARGCDVAWRGRRPTFVRDGEILELASCPRDVQGALPLRCTPPVLSRADVRRELGLELVVEEALWLSETRVAVILRGRTRDEAVEYLAVFEEGRVVTVPREGYADLSGLRRSPSGAFVVVRILDPGGLLVVDRDGEFVRPAVRHGHALAWSPDERWIAEATDDGVYVFRADDPTAPVHVLPFQAADLVWRP